MSVNEEQLEKAREYYLEQMVEMQLIQPDVVDEAMTYFIDVRNSNNRNAYFEIDHDNKLIIYFYYLISSL